MTNFANINVADMALAISKATPLEATERLARAAQHKAKFTIAVNDVTWAATSLAVRHGLLMEWIAGELTA
jgi:hypothetical protein